MKNVTSLLVFFLVNAAYAQQIKPKVVPQVELSTKESSDGIKLTGHLGFLKGKPIFVLDGRHDVTGNETKGEMINVFAHAKKGETFTVIGGGVGKDIAIGTDSGDKEPIVYINLDDLLGAKLMNNEQQARFEKDAEKLYKDHFFTCAINGSAELSIDRLLGIDTKDLVKITGSLFADYPTPTYSDDQTSSYKVDTKTTSTLPDGTIKEVKTQEMRYTLRFGNVGKPFIEKFNSLQTGVGVTLDSKSFIKGNSAPKLKLELISERTKGRVGTMTSFSEIAGGEFKREDFIDKSKRFALTLSIPLGNR